MNARAIRFPLFDSLRAIAALAIFGTHAYASLHANDSGLGRQFAGRLEVGVYIFFAISGFLLYRPFVRARLRDFDRPATGGYLWRRMLRIGPAYWVALSIVAVWLHMRYVVDPVSNAPWYYLFGQSYRPYLAIGGLSQAWSLSVEAAFYLFLPLYALAMRCLPAAGDRARLRNELGGLAVLTLLGLLFTVLAVNSGTTNGDTTAFPLHLTLPCYLHVFGAGMCVAVLSVWYEGRELPGWLRPLDRFPGMAWGVALVAFCVASLWIGIDGHPGEHVSATQWTVRSSLYVVIALGVVLPAVFGDQARGLVRRVLANRALLWVGLVSYSFFLYHLAVVIQVQRWDLPAGGAVALVLSLALAAASYYLIERPALKLKGLVGRRPEPAPGEALAEPAPAVPARATHAS
jgi:peptidoglycan/LPS O-acetylase OafA/YrhL